MNLQGYRMGLATTLLFQGRWEEMGVLISQITRARKEMRDELPWFLNSVTTLASLCWVRGQVSEAKELQVHTVEVIRRMYGPQRSESVNAEDMLSLFEQDVPQDNLQDVQQDI